MCALLRIADSSRASREVRKVPTTEVGAAIRCAHAATAQSPRRQRTTGRRFDLVLKGALADDGANENISRESAMAPVLRVFLAAALLLSGVAPSLAQGYPNRPVRVVVGFPAGGPTDVIARIVAQRLSESLGQQFFVENIGGAGGNTAAGQVARVAPDGYTIMAISTGFVVNPSLYAKVPYDPVRDFSAVSL